jgi:hypothetical protein
VRNRARLDQQVSSSTHSSSDPCCVAQIAATRYRAGVVVLDPLATTLYEKSEVTNATSRITNAMTAIPASAYIARRAESTNSRRPLRAP